MHPINSQDCIRPLNFASLGMKIVTALQVEWKLLDLAKEECQDLDINSRGQGCKGAAKIIRPRPRSKEQSYAIIGQVSGWSLGPNQGLDHQNVFHLTTNGFASTIEGYFLSL